MSIKPGILALQSHALPLHQPGNSLPANYFIVYMSKSLFSKNKKKKITLTPIFGIFNYGRKNLRPKEWTKTG